MTALARLENDIQSLPPHDFLNLMEWMEDRHLQLLANNGFEAPELEAAILQGLDGQHHEWNDATKERIRAAWGEAKSA